MSRSLMKAEYNYAQIEKECLMSSINKKNLSDCLLRIQKLLLRLQKYDIGLVYTPGKFMYTSDVLSCAYLKTPVDPQSSREAEVNV